MLTIVKFSHIGKNRLRNWIALCDCGNETTVMTTQLKNGTKKSCGCFKIDMLVKRSTKHGMTLSREYKTYAGMRYRCLNPRSKHWKDYGGRGIGISKEWADGFDNFYRDMGERPKGMSIERKNNDLGYSKENCEWATPKKQSLNRRERSGSHTRNGRKCLKPSLICFMETVSKFSVHDFLEEYSFHRGAVCIMLQRLEVDGIVEKCGKVGQRVMWKIKGESL